VQGNATDDVLAQHDGHDDGQAARAPTDRHHQSSSNVDSEGIVPAVDINIAQAQFTRHPLRFNI